MLFERGNMRTVLISRILDSISSTISTFKTIRLDKGRIDNLAVLIEFTHTRAAYVAQTSLYGYLKTRMGTRFRVIFEDDAFAAPLANAKWRTYAACLSDLSVFAVSTIVQAGELDAAQSAQLAQHCFKSAVTATFDDCDIADLQADIVERFAQRCAYVDWQSAGDLENAFTVSPGELIGSAPVIEEYKELDREIVTNSIRFRWRDVREQFRKRVDGAPICAEWSGLESTTGDAL